MKHQMPADNAFFMDTLFCALLRWTTAFWSIGSHFHEAEIQSVWTLNIAPQRVIHSGRVTDGVSTAHSRDFLSSSVKELCHFQFNMQRCRKGMLILAFITRTALPDCVCLVRHSSAGRVQVGARYGRQSYATSKLKDCRRTSRHSAYCWLIIY